MKSMLAGLAACASFAAGAAPSIHRFYGYAYDLDTHRYLYTEVHAENVDGDRWYGGTVRYYGPDNQLIASKTTAFSADPLIPVFRLEIPGQHYVEAITAVTDQSITLFKSDHGRSRTETVTRTPGMVADAGFHSAIVAHFAELRAGETLHFRFAVAGLLDTFSFRCRKIGEKALFGKPAMILRVEPDSLLRWIADPLTLGYELSTRHLIDYQGASDLHDPNTGKAYTVHIVYPDRPPTDAPRPLPPLP